MKKLILSLFLLFLFSSHSFAYNAHLPLIIQNQQVIYNNYNFFTAVFHGDDKTVEAFLKHNKAYANAENNGLRALHFASQEDHLKIVELLIQYGADVNIKDKHGRLALHYASYNNYSKIAELLIENGTILGLKDDSGKSSLDYARLSKTECLSKE